MLCVSAWVSQRQMGAFHVTTWYEDVGRSRDEGLERLRGRGLGFKEVCGLRDKWGMWGFYQRASGSLHDYLVYGVRHLNKRRDEDFGMGFPEIC